MQTDMTFCGQFVVNFFYRFSHRMASLTNNSVFSQGFEAITSSSGGIQSLIDIRPDKYIHRRRAKSKSNEETGGAEETNL